MNEATVIIKPPSAILKWAGVFSLVWVALVPMLFKLFPRYFYFHIFQRDQFEWLGVAALVSWWPIGLLLAIGGLFSRSQVGRTTGLLTCLGFLIFLLWFLVLPKLGVH